MYYSSSKFSVVASIYYKIFNVMNDKNLSKNLGVIKFTNELLEIKLK